MLSVKNGLTYNGYQVDAYSEPLKAIAEFAPNKYDLAIIDFRMPKMNGLELYNQIKKLDKNIKICFLTASEEYEDFSKMFPNAGTQCFLKKPIALKNLVLHIKSELEHGH